MAGENHLSDLHIIEEFIDDSYDDDDSDASSFDDNVAYESENAYDDEDGEACETFLSPGGTRYWVPIASNGVKLDVGDEFSTIDEADSAYRNYAADVGFDVRQANRKKNKEGDVQTRYLLCSRQGIPLKKEYDTLNLRPGQHKIRNSSVKRTGCKACIKFRLRKHDKRYVVYKHEVIHNHSLYSSTDKRFSRSRRQLKYSDYRNLYNATSSSVGALKSHSIQTALKGGVEYIGASEVDYKNASRDLISFVGIKDAQMLINLMSKRKKKVPDFSFEYLIKKDELHAVFWADEVSKLNYKEFGDTISFDATYRTNRHAMNFVPFIAIDNHKRSVVVGSALISKENAPNFTWIFSAFLRAHQKQPRFVITDQCPAMKQAVPAVFTESKHRLCAWHIMSKVPKEVTVESERKEEFNKRFKRLVWSTHIDPEDFESEWKNIVDDFGLHKNEWLADKYTIREAWISAYYKNDPMSGLMRTTSRSESSHAYFRLFASFKNDFVRFIRAFDGSIDKQRNKHACLEFANRHSYPRVVTPLLIERHASEVYTKIVFFDVQKQIEKALYFCCLKLVDEVGDIKRYVVTHTNKKTTTEVSYEVVHHEGENTFECQCNQFRRIGLLCRHIFKILLNNGDNKIPDEYISRRWTRALVPVQIQSARARYGEIDVEKEGLINGMYAGLDSIVSRVRNDKKILQEVSEAVEGLMVKYGAVNDNGNTTNDRTEALREYYGVDPPKDPTVLPASGICNKGSGTGKRLKGVLEKAIEKSKRAKRLCRGCGKHAHHDKRNCPGRP